MKLANKPINARPYSIDIENAENLQSRVAQEGMTLLEYYAGLAMQAFLANQKDQEYTFGEIAEWAVAQAQRLIAELEKVESNE